MVTTLITLELPTATGMPEDNVVNSFVVEHNDPFNSIMSANVAAHLSTFYNGVPTGGLTAIMELLSPQMSRATNCPIKAYDITAHLDGSPHGSPVQEQGMALSNISGAPPDGLPAEVAIVATLHGWLADSQPVEAPDGSDADTARDRPRQRRMGRLFVGHLNRNCLSVVDGAVRPHANIRDTLRLACKDLAQNLIDDGMEWSVWSRKAGNTYPIVGVSTDNAFDTQRRRGVDPTARGFTAIP